MFTELDSSSQLALAMASYEEYRHVGKQHIRPPGTSCARFNWDRVLLRGVS